MVRPNQLIWPVRDAITKREKVSKRGEPARYEDAVVDPGVDDKHLLVFNPEFAGALAAMRREGSTLSSIVRNGWDRDGEARRRDFRRRGGPRMTVTW